MSVNKAILIGRLGSDPEVRYTQSGQAVANFNIATSENWTDQSGQRQERTEWHRIVVWGRQAEICKQYLNKGRQVYVEGRLQTREWTDQSGQSRRTTEVKADSVRFLGGRDEGTNAKEAPPMEEQGAGFGFGGAPAPDASTNVNADGPAAPVNVNAGGPAAPANVNTAGPAAPANLNTAGPAAPANLNAGGPAGQGAFTDDDIPF